MDGLATKIYIRHTWATQQGGKRYTLCLYKKSILFDFQKSMYYTERKRENFSELYT